MHDLIDIGANLTHDAFDKDRADVLQRAIDAGVRRQIVTGTTLEASRAALALARQYPQRLYATAGVHPHHAEELDTGTLKAFNELIIAEEIVAVGECGLDYFRNYAPHAAQQSAFEQQLALAVEVQKPLFLHQRDAFDAFITLLKNQLDDIPGGVAHCFTGTKDELRTCLDLGLYIGITGWICDERRGHDLQEAVQYLPLDRLMLETDAPYLLPRDLKDKPDGRRNEPSVLPHILKTVARYKNADPETVAAAATGNTERLFQITST